MVEQDHIGLCSGVTRFQQAASICNKIIKLASIVVLSIIIVIVVVPGSTKATEMGQIISEDIKDEAGVNGVLPAVSNGGTNNSGGNYATGERVVWTDSRCGTCHETNTLFSHPVNISPSMQVPEGLPLYRGQVVCTTCHVNDNPAAHAEARVSDKSLLRMDLTPEQLCLKCHDPMSGNRVDLHATALNQAHMSRVITDEVNGGVKKSLDSDFGGERIDGESQMCLTCHDGTVASAASASSSSAFGGSFSDIEVNHPIGVNYDSQSRGMDRDSDLQHKSMLDPRIRLFDNRVGCNSCHSLFSRDDHHLVMSNYGSKLCLSCHKM